MNWNWQGLAGSLPACSEVVFLVRPSRVRGWGSTERDWWGWQESQESPESVSLSPCHHTFVFLPSFSLSHLTLVYLLTTPSPSPYHKLQRGGLVICLAGKTRDLIIKRAARASGYIYNTHPLHRKVFFFYFSLGKWNETFPDCWPHHQLEI